MKMTMKAFAKTIKSTDGHFHYSLAVVNDLGIIEDVLLKSGDINQATDIEKWFAFDKLDDDQHLIRFLAGQNVNWQELEEDTVGGEWHLIPA